MGAFDTVNYNTLLNRLKVLTGVSGSALEWRFSYLSGRTFSIRVNSFSSYPACLTCEVPQSSILGPLLFSFDMLHHLILLFSLFDHFMVMTFNCTCLLNLTSWVVQLGQARIGSSTYFIVWIRVRVVAGLVTSYQKIPLF